ncbi:MAG: archaellin/type IV pilin N-terminal domain-containing protein [Candidatus Hodarchaeota archaeon]
MKTRFHFKRRGMSPLLATILLIALVIVGGALVFIVLSGLFTQNAPLDLEVEAISDFKSEDGDIQVDRFQVSIKNLRTETALIKMSEIEVFIQDQDNDDNYMQLAGWRAVETANEYLISGKETINIDLHCINPDHELFPRVDVIRVDFNAYRSNDRDGTPTNFKSGGVRVGQTYGPVGLSIQSSHTLDSNLTLTVSNNGTTDLDLVVELSGKAEFLFNNTPYRTSTAFSLEGITINPVDKSVTVNPNTEITLTWNVTTTTSLDSGTYYVTIRIFDSSLRTMAFTLVPFNV